MEKETKPENKGIFMDKDSHGKHGGGFGGQPKETPLGRMTAEEIQKTENPEKPESK